jgi:hypothetical protein
MRHSAKPSIGNGLLSVRSGVNRDFLSSGRADDARFSSLILPSLSKATRARSLLDASYGRPALSNGSDEYFVNIGFSHKRFVEET